MAPSSIKITRFDPSKMKKEALVVCIGKRGTGKTTLVTDLLSHYVGQIPMSFVMSGTEESNEHYQKCFPPLYIYSGYDQDVVQQLILQQKKMIRCLKKNKSDESPHALLLLDDCMYDRGITRSKTMRELFYNGRHFKLLVVITMQYSMDLTPDMRSQVDYVFCGRENIPANRERLWKNFFGTLDYKQFCTLLDQCTKNYEVLCLDNTKTSNSATDSLHYYKARCGIKYKFGAPELWQYSRRHTKRDDSDDSDEEGDDDVKKTSTIKSIKL